MKTIFTSLLAIALMFALSGCCSKNACAYNSTNTSDSSNKTC